LRWRAGRRPGGVADERFVAWIINAEGLGGDDHLGAALGPARRAVLAGETFDLFKKNVWV
jgi:hypothetical protein